MQEKQPGPVKPRRRRGERPAVKSKKPASLEESWQSLDYFSRHNLGRQLGADEGVSSVPIPRRSVYMMSSARAPSVGPSANVHFVNIGEAEDAVEVVDTKNTSEGSSYQESPDVLFSRREPVETKQGEVVSLPSTEFVIPSLPKGKLLKIQIISTW